MAVQIKPAIWTTNIHDDHRFDKCITVGQKVRIKLRDQADDFEGTFKNLISNEDENTGFCIILDVDGHREAIYTYNIERIEPVE